MEKEWEEEPNFQAFVYKGYGCEIKRMSLGHLCGYVYIPRGHKVFGKNYNALDHIDCHGGLTFSETNGDFTGIGFDCAHYMDYIPLSPFHFENEIYRNMTYVKNECIKIVNQLIEEE